MSRTRHVFQILATALCCLTGSLLVPHTLCGQIGGRNYVELNILTDPTGGLDRNQKWLEVLSQVNADSVRLSNATGSARPDVQKTGTGSGASYKVTGIITRQSQLILPGGRFSIRDTEQIKTYIESIRADGAEVALAEKMAFGLTAEQLVSVHANLSNVHEESTVGVTPMEILNHVRRSCAIPIVVDPGASAALAEEYKIQDELAGLSHGTALAAALRPLGLVVAPRREQGKETEIVIADTRRVDEHWPIGWPLEQRPSKVVPRLFERIPVNIRNYTLKAALPAIQGALEIPFLYDYNSMAREGVDLEKIRVNLESEKLSYQLILGRIVSQARPRMEFEVRADENGKPFVWFAAR